jgi:hypothetical protein
MNIDQARAALGHEITLKPPPTERNREEAEIFRGKVIGIAHLPQLIVETPNGTQRHYTLQTIAEFIVGPKHPGLVYETGDRELVVGDRVRVHVPDRLEPSEPWERGVVVACEPELHVRLDSGPTIRADLPAISVQRV